MLHGDISNSVEPRLMVVFEGLIALPPQKPGAKVIRLFGRRAGKSRALIRDMEINEKAIRAITDAVWRYNYTVDIVTFLPEEFAPHIEELLEDLGIPYGRFTCEERFKFARSLNYRLDVVGVFSPDRNDILVFGSKGYYVDPTAPRLVGQF